MCGKQLVRQRHYQRQFQVLIWPSCASAFEDEFFLFISGISEVFTPPPLIFLVNVKAESWIAVLLLGMGFKGRPKSLFHWRPFLHLIDPSDRWLSFAVYQNRMWVDCLRLLVHLPWTITQTSAHIFEAGIEAITESKGFLDSLGARSHLPFCPGNPWPKSSFAHTQSCGHWLNIYPRHSHKS